MRTPLAAVTAAVAALLLLGTGCAAPSAGLGPGSGTVTPLGPSGTRPSVTGHSGTGPGTRPSVTGPSGTGPSGSARPPDTTPPGATTFGGGVFDRVFVDPDLTVADGSLYLTWELSLPTRLPPRMALARAGIASGQILAENDFGPGLVSLPVYAAGSVWVTDSAPAGELLLRLDPRTLMVTGELQVADGNTHPGIGEHVAFAGGSIWVDGGDRLLKVAPESVEPQRIIPLPGAASSHVSASPDGRTLIVSEANDQGAGTVQRRDSRTGALLAWYRVVGVVAPLIAGAAGGVTWIAEPTGMMGYVERYQTARMTPDPATLVEGTNGIRAGIWVGRLWVHGPDGGTQTNYCADPGSGRRLASLPMPYRSQPNLLAVGAKELYYSYFTSDDLRSRIAAAPIPAACLRAGQHGMSG